MVKIPAALVAALSIMNSSGAIPGATEKVAALVARATCSGASHSSENILIYIFFIDFRDGLKKIHRPTKVNKRI